MPDWRYQYFELIEDCEKRDTRLSAWDADFLESVKARLLDRKPLTQKQVECLEEIWERTVARG